MAPIMLTVEDIDQRQPRLISDEEIAFNPDWHNEPKRASLQRSYRSLSGGHAYTPDDLDYIASLPPDQQLPYFSDTVKWFGVSVALEAAYRMEIKPDHRAFLIQRIEAYADAADSDYESEMAVEVLPPDELDDDERAVVEATADKLRAAGCRVSVGKLSGNPFAAWAERQRETIDTANHIEAISWNLTLDAIRILPTFRARSSTGQRSTSSRHKKTSPGRDPDRPRKPLTSAERRSLAEAIDAAARERLARPDEPHGADGARSCPCNCGTFVPRRPNQVYANGATCRKRAERQRKRDTGC